MNEIRMHLDNFIIIVMDNLFCYSKLLQWLDSIILSNFVYFFYYFFSSTFNVKFKYPMEGKNQKRQRVAKVHAQ